MRGELPFAVAVTAVVSAIVVWATRKAFPAISVGMCMLMFGYLFRRRPRGVAFWLKVGLVVGVIVYIWERFVF